MMQPDDSIVPVVLDFGSWTFKAGLAGALLPKIIDYSVFGEEKNISAPDDILIERYFGKFALDKRKYIDMKYPIIDCEIDDWDDFGYLCKYIIDKELNIKLDNHPLFICESSCTRKHQRKKMIEVLFETINCCGVYIEKQPKLILLGSGRTDGVSFDCGQYSSRVASFCDGQQIPESVFMSKIGGITVTQNLFSKILSRNDPKSFQTDMHELRKIKESICYVTSGDENRIQSCNENKSEFGTYQVPDGTVLKLSKNDCSCPEVLFNPKIEGLNKESIQTIIIDSIENCESTLKNMLASNIVVSGGSTMIPGFVKRITDEITYNSSIQKINVIAPPKRFITGWIGGSIYSMIYTTRNSWISKIEYNQYGASIVDKKCL